ncbi:MAG TPA: hypothetical protein VK983_04410 [Candidatus Limnocylindrales bacterium]|nr:hypothetical protein [Candidatus Limnocylindrales bacterium]
MILEQFQTPNWRLSKRRIARQYRRTKRQVSHVLHIKYRRSERTLYAYFRKQYFPTTALADTRLAIKKNEDIFLGTLLVSLVLGYAFSVSGLTLALEFMAVGGTMASALGLSEMLLYFVAGSVFAVAIAWLVVFLLNVSSIAIHQGATHKRYRSLIATLRAGLGRTSRVTGTWIAFFALLAVPLAILGMLALQILLNFELTENTTIALMTGCVIAACTWIVGVLMNFSLAPYIACLEEQVTILESFVRSRQLVMRRGRLFTLGTYTLLCLGLGAAFLVGRVIGTVTPIGSGAIFTILTVPVLLATNGIFTTLYRKRRLARA